MGAPALGRIHHQRALQPQLLAQQMVMNSTHGQQGRHRRRGGGQRGSRPRAIDPVGQHQNLGSVTHRLFRNAAQRRDGLLQASRTRLHSHLGGDRLDGQTLLTDGRQFRLVQNGRLQMDDGGSFRLGLQGGPALTQVHLQAHHQLFPQGIDRRVGDLGETLLEVVVKQVGLVGEHRQGDVIAHAVGRLLAEGSHVLDDQIEVFGGEPHRGLQPQQIEFTHLPVLGPGLGGHAAAMLLQPIGIREALRRVFLHRPVVEQLAAFKIDGHHLTRAKTTFLNNRLAAEIHHAGLRSHDHEAVSGGAPTRRTQPIAIERCTHSLAVGEHQQGRAVPGFLNARVEFVHRRHIGTAVEIGLIAKRFGHQCDQAVGDRPPTAHHQFQSGVQVGGIAEGRVHHRNQVISRLTPDVLEAGF